MSTSSSFVLYSVILIYPSQSQYAVAYACNSAVLSCRSRTANLCKSIKMFHNRSVVNLLLFFLCFIHLSSSLPDRYFKSVPTSLHENVSAEYFEVTKPTPSDPLNPSCSSLLLQHDFANTMGSPPVSVIYSPPLDCPQPWTQIFLEFRASCKGEQYDRIVGIWLDGVEILRTSTAEPTESGIFWKVRKDVTKYSSLLLKPSITLTVMLENVVNEVYTGIYHVNVSLLYYGGKETRVLHQVSDQMNKDGKLGVTEENFAVAFVENFGGEGELGLLSEESRGRSNTAQKGGIFSEKPADLIIPISGNGDGGFWFRIEDAVGVNSKDIQIPLNTHRAVLEIYVSFHGDDEFWYSNPPNAYIEQNQLSTGRGNGAFREIIVKMDGVFIGSVMPFPVIFTGGINPLLWEPVVAIGAFNLPSYDLDLTPFLGSLLDGKSHSFGLGVTDSIPFWLVDANLHLWLDHGSSSVMAMPIIYQAPAITIQRNSKFNKLDGSFKIETNRRATFSGWVKSSAGNLTTQVSHEFKFKNKIKFKGNGQVKEVKQKIKVKTEVTVESLGARYLISRTFFKRKYPLKIIISTQPGSQTNTSSSSTNLSHSLIESTSRTLPSGRYTSSISNNQVSVGWMEVQDHSVLSGGASTHQTLSYRDEYGCYTRAVSTTNGKLLEDNSDGTCAHTTDLGSGIVDAVKYLFHKIF